MMKPFGTPRGPSGLDQRRRVRTRRRWSWRSLGRRPVPQIVVLLAALGGIYALTTSRLFVVTTVEAVAPPALRSLLASECRCTDGNIFLAQPNDIRNRLAVIPWLDVHQVYTRLPNRIVIDAGMRQVAALWRTPLASYAVDAAGHVLYDVQMPPPQVDMVPTTASVPLIYSPTDRLLHPGQSVPALAVHMARETRGDLDSSIAPSVDIYRWSAYTGLTVHSHIGWWFALGINVDNAPDYIPRRLATLTAANKARIFKDGRCNYVDLRTITRNADGTKGQVYCNYQKQWHEPLGPG